MQAMRDKFGWVLVRWTTALRALKFYKHDNKFWEQLARKAVEVNDLYAATKSKSECGWCFRTIGDPTTYGIPAEMQAHLQVCPHNPMAVQLKMAASTLEDIDAYIAGLKEKGGSPTLSSLLSIRDDLAAALEPPILPDSPVKKYMPATVTVARATWTYESMFEQLAEKAEASDAATLATAVRMALSMCRTELGSPARKSSPERIRELAEEAAHCIFTTGVNVEDATEYLNEFIGEIFMEVLLGAPHQEGDDVAPAAEAGP
jgi:hypothetical protein